MRFLLQQFGIQSIPILHGGKEKKEIKNEREGSPRTNRRPRSRFRFKECAFLALFSPVSDGGGPPALRPAQAGHGRQVHVFPYPFVNFLRNQLAL